MRPGHADLQGLVPERLSGDQGSVGEEPGTRGQERLGARGRTRRRDSARNGPGANILLVAPTGSETLGVQGFPNMMKAEKYVVDNHLAQVISQSFASAEDAFGSSASLENLRDAFKAAAASGVTVFGSSGDGGTANGTKQPVGKGGDLIPYPTVVWPAFRPARDRRRRYVSLHESAREHERRTRALLRFRSRREVRERRVLQPAPRPGRGRLDVLGRRLQQ